MQSVSSRFIVSSVLYLGLLVAVVFCAGRAEAATVPVSCAAGPVIENFKPYVYEDGVLHSFDYTVVGDGVPTVTATAVGSRSLENFYSTTWQTGTANSKKVHVDVPSWYGFSGETHVSVNIMTASSTGCAVQKEFVVQLPAHPIMGPVSGSDTSAPAKSGPGETPSQKGPTTDAPSPDTAAEGIKGGLLGSLLASFFGKGAGATDQCVGWPRGTWIFLTIICIAAVLVILDSLPYLLTGNGARFAIVLLAMFLVLLALWFTFDRCRENRWFPLVVTLLTLGTLVMPTALEGKRGRTKKFPF